MNTLQILEVGLIFFTAGTIFGFIATILWGAGYKLRSYSEWIKENDEFRDK